jgi:hypothetical protein
VWQVEAAPERVAATLFWGKIRLCSKEVDNSGVTLVFGVGKRSFPSVPRHVDLVADPTPTGPGEKLASELGKWPSASCGSGGAESNADYRCGIPARRAEKSRKGIAISVREKNCARAVRFGGCRE